MSTDLIRRCDVCARIIPSALPIAVVDLVVRGASTAARRGLDVCSEACVHTAARVAYQDAIRPVEASAACVTNQPAYLRDAGSCEDVDG